LKNLELEEGTTLCIEIFQREWNPGKVTRWEEDVGLEGDCLRNFKLKGKAQRYCFAFWSNFSNHIHKVTLSLGPTLTLKFHVFSFPNWSETRKCMKIKHHLLKLGITSQNLKDLIFTRCELMKNISSSEDASNTNLRTLVRANLKVRTTNLIS
jgi:hypothetical protein